MVQALILVSIYTYRKIQTFYFFVETHCLHLQVEYGHIIAPLSENYTMKAERGNQVVLCAF